MPEAVADTLMAHLPPAGWSDVARTSDINHLRADIDALRADTKERFEAVRAEIDALRADTKERFDKVDARFDKVDARFDKVDARFDELASMKRYVITTGIAIIATILAAWSPLWFELL
jgi:predicted phage gp36 major capsid-like protein